MVKYLCTRICMHLQVPFLPAANAITFRKFFTYLIVDHLLLGKDHSNQHSLIRTRCHNFSSSLKIEVGQEAPFSQTSVPFLSNLACIYHSTNQLSCPSPITLWKSMKSSFLDTTFRCRETMVGCTDACQCHPFYISKH